jgi:murein endopeptidase
LEGNLVNGALRIGLVAVAFCAASAVAHEQALAETPQGKAVEVDIRSGDSLLRIAARYGVSVDDLRAWNKDRIGPDDLIKVGDKLVVLMPPGEMPTGPAAGPLWTGFYDIKRGDTLGRIAKRLSVSVGDLVRWNGIRNNIIKAGDVLVYKKQGARPKARSIGRPTKGRLVGARYLGKGEGYRLRFPKNAYGIPRINELIRTCAKRVKDAFPGTADILVGDISRPTGGHFPPHQSHQSGRDADIGYYLKGNIQNKTMYRVNGTHVDHRKNWTLLKCLLEEERVVRVYMDTGIQKAMVKFLVKKEIISKELATRLFEAYVGKKGRGLIRHSPHHDTHIHVRLACTVGEKDCKEESADTVFSF